MKRKILFLLFLLFIMFMPFIVNAETLYNHIKNSSVLDNKKSEFVSSNDGIHFELVSSDTNGKGIYEYSATSLERFPILYYRGNVNNNNVKIKDSCWLIVRTTSTGGIKLVYNGKSTNNEQCGDNIGIGTGIFNNSSNSIAEISYMYGNDIYEAKRQGLEWFTFDKPRSRIQQQLPTSENYLASSEVEYVDGVYKLINPTEATRSTFSRKYSCFSSTRTTCNVVQYVVSVGSTSGRDYVVYIPLDSGDTYESLYANFQNNLQVKFGSNFVYENGTYHIVDDVTYNINNWNYIYNVIGDKKYTCMNSSGECQNIKYLTYGQSKEFIYILLSNGDSFETALEKMKSPYNDSEIKKVIDSWYENNLKDVSSLFEDTIWCNNKHIPKVDDDLAVEYSNKGFEFENSNYYIKFEDYMKYYYLDYPSLTCDSIDSYTTSKENGNGALKYPIGLLTSGEILLAGYPKYISSDAYLSSLNNWYLLTPYEFNSSGLIAAIYGNRGANAGVMCNHCLIRPAVSLKNSIKIQSGDGSIDNPYIVASNYSINVEIVNETNDLNVELNDLTQVSAEENVKFNVTPIKGYKVTNIKIVDEENNEIDYIETDNKNEYSFLMPFSDVTIIPSYERVSNAVIVEDNENTKEIVIEVNDSKAVVYEDVVRFTITPENGYEVETIEIIDKDNNKIEYKKTKNDNEYEFIMPDTDVIIKPKYREIGSKNALGVLKNPNTENKLSIILLLIIIVFVIETIIYKKKKSRC